MDHDGEVILYCESSARVRKEEAMKARLEKHFGVGLQSIASSLAKKRGTRAMRKSRSN